jgi:hypothetical protein
VENEKFGIFMIFFLFFFYLFFFFGALDWSKCLVSLKVFKLHEKGQPSVMCMSVHW